MVVVVNVVRGPLGEGINLRGYDMVVVVNVVLLGALGEGKP